MTDWEHIRNFMIISHFCQDIKQALKCLNIYIFHATEIKLFFVYLLFIHQKK